MNMSIKENLYSLILQKYEEEKKIKTEIHTLLMAYHCIEEEKPEDMKKMFDEYVEGFIKFKPKE